MELSSKNEKIVRIIAMIALLGLGTSVVLYFWSVDSFSDVVYVPVHVMTLCIAYVLVQVAKRYIIKEQNWWDWLYYLGLASVMLPPLLENEEQIQLYSILTDFGTLFLLVPVLFDGRKILKQG